jgi:hypothetical protein
VFVGIDPPHVHCELIVDFQELPMSSSSSHIWALFESFGTTTQTMRYVRASALSFDFELTFLLPPGARVDHYDTNSLIHFLRCTTVHAKCYNLPHSNRCLSCVRHCNYFHARNLALFQFQCTAVWDITFNYQPLAPPQSIPIQSLKLCHNRYKSHSIYCSLILSFHLSIL